MIRDRGNIKWVSMMLPEHVQQLKALAMEAEKISKPFLDEQTYEQFDEIICEAMMGNSLLCLSYYKNGAIKTIQGRVEEVDVIQKQLQIVAEDRTNYELKLENIVAVEKMD